MPKSHLRLPPSIRIELDKAWIPYTAANSVFERFGHLPLNGKKELLNRLIVARLSYSFRVMIDPPEKSRSRQASQAFPTHSQQLSRLVKIQRSAKRLLKLLGIEDPASIAVEPFEKGMGILHSVATTWLLTSLSCVATGRRGDRATLGALERIEVLLLLLSDLVEAADQSAEQVRAHMVAKMVRDEDTNRTKIPNSGRSARGGKRRRGETAESMLVRSLIEAYIALRARYPNSGPSVSCDDALRAFVRAGLEFAIAERPITDSKGKVYVPTDTMAVNRTLPCRFTDSAIRGIFDRCMHKPIRN